jgi:hypothetical protein
MNELPIDPRPQVAPIQILSVTTNTAPFKATPRQWLVRKLIRKIRRGGSIWGLPGQGKGVFAIFLALCLAYGIDIDGRKTEKVSKVLYIDAEDDLQEFSNRVRQTHAGLCLLLGEELPEVEPAVVVYKNIQMDDVDAASGQLRQEIAQEGAAVVIYDALQSVFGGNQSTGEVGSQVWNWIQRTAVECGHTPLAIDHCGWQGKHEQGSVQKRGRVGQSIQVLKRAGSEVRLPDGSEEQVIDVYLRKSNYQVGSDAETPVLSIKCIFKVAPCLIQEPHVEPDDCFGPTLFEYVEPPQKSAATVSQAIAVLEARRRPVEEAELAILIGKTRDALRKAIERERKTGNPELERLVSRGGSRGKAKTWEIVGQDKL